MSDEVGTVSPSALIVCDEVRKELTGKETMIGVYTGGIVFTKLPAALTIAIVLLFEVTAPGKVTITLELKSAGQTRDVNVELFLSRNSNSRQTEFFAINSIVVPFKNAGLFEIYFRQNQGEPILLRTLPVTSDEKARVDTTPRLDASVPMMFPEQSPPDAS